MWIGACSVLTRLNSRIQTFLTSWCALSYCVSKDNSPRASSFLRTQETNATSYPALDRLVCLYTHAVLTAIFLNSSRGTDMH